MRRAWSHRLVVIALVAGIAALVLVRAGSAGRARETRLLAEMAARLDASDPNWRLDDLLAEYNRRLPPPEGNAGEFARVAVAKMTVPLPQSLPKAIFFAEGAPPNRLGPPDADAPVLDELRAKHAAVIGELRDARRFAGSGFPLRPRAGPNPSALDYSVFEPLHTARALLLLDAAVSSRRGEAGTALESCTALCALADPEPTRTVGGMYEPFRAALGAERALALAGVDPPEATLAELQSKFAAARSREFLREFYRYRRAYWFGWAERVGSGEESPAGYFGLPGGAPKLAERALHGRVVAEAPTLQRLVLEHFGKLLAATELPDPARYSAEDALNTWKTWRVVGRPGAADYARHCLPLDPTWRWDREAHGLRALAGCAEVAMACERLRLKSGRYPASLSELPAELLAAIPTDPFTSKPLLYTVRPDGVTVYSAGPDGADDGGTLDPAGDRLTPPAGADIGFRLWNPELRRLSASP